jgi:hypothetical protein
LLLEIQGITILSVKTNKGSTYFKFIVIFSPIAEEHNTDPVDRAQFRWVVLTGVLVVQRISLLFKSLTIYICKRGNKTLHVLDNVSQISHSLPVRKSPQQLKQQVSCSTGRSREVPYHSIFAPHCRHEH